MACLLSAFYRKARRDSDSGYHHSRLSQCLNCIEAEAVWLSANSSAEHKTPPLPLCSHGRALTWLGQISRLLKWQMFFTGTFVCVCVRACVYTTCMSLRWLGNYSLGIRRLHWMGVLICFNPDDECWSVPWAPIKSPERYTNKSSCCQYITWICRIYCRHFPSFRLWYWPIFTRSQDRIGCWSSFIAENDKNTLNFKALDIQWGCYII